MRSKKPTPIAPPCILCGSMWAPRQRGSDFQWRCDNVTNCHRRMPGVPVLPHHVNIHTQHNMHFTRPAVHRGTIVRADPVVARTVCGLTRYVGQQWLATPLDPAALTCPICSKGVIGSHIGRGRKGGRIVHRTWWVH